MSVAWKINDELVSELLLSNLQLKLRSQAVDLLTFREDGALIDSAPRFAYGADIVLTRDEVTVFRGRVVKVTPASRGSAEGIRYTVHGPWWYLVNLVYQQSWSVYGRNVSRQLLGFDSEGAKVDAGDQLADVVSYATSAGAPLALSQDLDLDLPAEELRDRTCAEIIQRLLRWHPDRVAYFDYTPETPVLTIAKRSSLDAATLDLSEEAVSLTSTSVVARDDLVPGYVELIYERTDTVDGVATRVTTPDRYPAVGGDAFRALVETIDLQGGSASSIKQKVRVASVLLGSADWWKDHVSWLRDANISALTVSGGDGETLGDELVEGAIADWMQEDVETSTVTALANYTIDHGGGVEETVVGERLTVQIKTTTAATRTYQISNGGSQAEPTPVGLAQGLYTALATTQFEGSVTLVEEEALGNAFLGRVLNLSNAATAWASMTALVQSVDIDIDAGTTAISFGPPAFLSAGDLVDLLRVGRQRRTFGPALRTGGDGSEPDEVGSVAGQANGQALKSQPLKATLDLDGQVVNVDLYSSDSPDGTGLTLKLREVTVCDNGVPRKALSAVTEPYDPPA